MNKSILALLAASGLIIFSPATILAHGDAYYDNVVPVYPGQSVYIQGYPNYRIPQSGYPYYGKPQPVYPDYRKNIYRYSGKAYAYPRYRLKPQKKILPSTSVYGYYPYKKPYTGYRVKPGASRLQQNKAYGYNSTYGYNRFSRRGYGRWYR